VADNNALPLEASTDVTYFFLIFYLAAFTVIVCFVYISPTSYLP